MKASIKAVLGPTNTGKTHLAIERMCAHSSGRIGFPLRLLAREVYDRVVAIKGEKQVALITGEERIEPPDARYFLCTAEAMPVIDAYDHKAQGQNAPAFVAIDEAQLGADPERGHIFTDRLLHARGREETMIMGSATLAPMIRALVPEAEITERPRFSTLAHAGVRKLSRLPPRSAIVAFSAEQVYVVAEMLRRFRGGSAVVMGALSPQTRNRQVAMFQAGEVDYIVATDAIGMGLNLDVSHVAFAALEKFDGTRKRRLKPAEMAQIAGRAGRHQKDGSFGTLASGQIGANSGTNIGANSGTNNGTRKGLRGVMPPPEFTEEEIYAIEEHRFAPLTHLFWRKAEPRMDSVAALIADLDAPPSQAGLRTAPEAIDLAVLKRLSQEAWAGNIRGSGAVRRFWETCRLPDFRQQGVDMHARFINRLWCDLQTGYIGEDFTAKRIAELDNVQGDIHALQGRIAAIRSWAYICQRPDWVLARDEMAARARAIEARLSDALHGRLTERFVNRRTAILMKALGEDPSLFPVELGEDGVLTVESEPLGQVIGFHFRVDPAAHHNDHKMLLAAAEKALPNILGDRASKLAQTGFADVTIERGTLRWQGRPLAQIDCSASAACPGLELTDDLQHIPETLRADFTQQLCAWLARQLQPLEPLAILEQAAHDPQAGSHARALLLNLIAGKGFVARNISGLEHLPKELRPSLRRLGVTFGALDVFAPALLKPAPRQLLHRIGADRRALQDAMLPVINKEGKLPAGYRMAGRQAVRIDLAEKILRAAHDARSISSKRRFAIDAALAISTGLTPESFLNLLNIGGFRHYPARALPEGTYGPQRADLFEWHPSNGKRARRKPAQKQPNHRQRDTRGKPGRGSGAFDGLADLLR